METNETSKDNKKSIDPDNVNPLYKTMIELYTGAPGGGKTLVLTRRILRALSRGYDVYANYDLTLTRKYPGKFVRWRRMDELYTLENGIIAMDEAHVYMNSRRWELLPDEMQVRLQQHRKDGLHIWGTAQSHKRLDLIYKELVQKWYHCRKLISWGRYDEPKILKVNKKGEVVVKNRPPPKPILGRFGYLLVTEQNPEEMEARTKKGMTVLTKIFSSSLVPITQEVVDAYSSQEKIRNDVNIVREVTHVQVVCPECGPLKPAHIH